MASDLIQLDGCYYQVISGEANLITPVSADEIDKVLPPESSSGTEQAARQVDCVEVEVACESVSISENRNAKHSTQTCPGSSQLQTMLLNDLPKQPQSLVLLDNVHNKDFMTDKSKKCQCYLSQDRQQGPVVFQVVKQNGSVCNMALNPVIDDSKIAEINEGTMEILKKDLSSYEKRVTCEGVVYICSFCKASFSRLANLKRHQLVHTINIDDDSRFGCSFCNKKFHQQCDMKRHLATHTGTEPFRCNLCNKGFIRKSDLQVHTRFHSRDRAFPCEFCEKAFYQSGDLNRHIRRVHLKSQLFACGHCSKKFQREATLSRHIQTAHSLLISKSVEHTEEEMSLDSFNSSHEKFT